MGDEVDFFCLQINKKVFCKLRVSFLVCVARNAQTTQNNKFKMSLHYLKENVKDEVDFLPVDKRQRFLQIETIVLVVCGQFISLQYLKKEVSDEVDFLHADRHQLPTSWFQHFRHRNFLQGDTFIIDGHDQAFSEYSK